MGPDPPAEYSGSCSSRCLLPPPGPAGPPQPTPHGINAPLLQEPPGRQGNPSPGLALGVSRAPAPPKPISGLRGIQTAPCCLPPRAALLFRKMRAAAASFLRLPAFGEVSSHPQGRERHFHGNKNRFSQTVPLSGSGLMICNQWRGVKRQEGLLTFLQAPMSKPP